MASLNRNGEFAHPETENVILGLLCSEISEERNLGVKLIIKIRNKLKDRRRVWPRQEAGRSILTALHCPISARKAVVCLC